MLITNEPHEQLEIKPNNDNESMSLVQRRRANIVDEWNIKIMILSKREALAIHQAIQDHILSPRRYSTANLRR